MREVLDVGVFAGVVAHLEDSNTLWASAANSIYIYDVDSGEGMLLVSPVS